jgi:hypothetical protein
MGRVENLNRKTIARKLKFLGKFAKRNLAVENAFESPSIEIEFDEMETFVHTKLKPLSIPLAVEFKTRRILGFQVVSMPAKGLLAKKSVKKYGRREDKRVEGRRTLFEEIRPLIIDQAILRSDSNPHYPADVKRYFPKASHQTVLGKRGAVTGQGELKKTKFDPIFSLNHTCAMFRAHNSRLIRKTWNTTGSGEIDRSSCDLCLCSQSKIEEAVLFFEAAVTVMQGSSVHENALLTAIVAVSP